MQFNIQFNITLLTDFFRTVSRLSGKSYSNCCLNTGTVKRNIEENWNQVIWNRNICMEVAFAVEFLEKGKKSHVVASDVITTKQISS